MAFRTYARHLRREDRAAKIIIKACVESGAGIEFLPEAPRFRFTPAVKVKDSFTPAGPGCMDDGPSGRGSIPCGKGNPLKLKNWSPSKLNANPMYDVPMRGDCEELRHARFVYARKGNPTPLRNYLRKLAAERREAEAVTLELFAA